MKFDGESLNLVSAGDRLFSSALDATDIVQKLVLMTEARRCYRLADIGSMVSIIDRWIGNGESQKTTV